MPPSRARQSGLPWAFSWSSCPCLQASRWIVAGHRAQAIISAVATALVRVPETRRNPPSDDSLDDNCDDSRLPCDTAYTTTCGRSCLVTASARSWQCGGQGFVFIRSASAAPLVMRGMNRQDQSSSSSLTSTSVSLLASLQLHAEGRWGERCTCSGCGPWPAKRIRKRDRSVVVYSTQMTGNRPELSGSSRSRWTINYLVAQLKTQTTGPVQIYGSVIRWSRVRAPPTPLKVQLDDVYASLLNVRSGARPRRGTGGQCAAAEIPCSGSVEAGTGARRRHGDPLDAAQPRYLAAHTSEPVAADPPARHHRLTDVLTQVAARQVLTVHSRGLGCPGRHAGAPTQPLTPQLIQRPREHRRPPRRRDVGACVKLHGLAGAADRRWLGADRGDGCLLVGS